MPKNDYEYHTSKPQGGYAEYKIRMKFCIEGSYLFADDNPFFIIRYYIYRYQYTSAHVPRLFPDIVIDSKGTRIAIGDDYE